MADKERNVESGITQRYEFSKPIIATAGTSPPAVRLSPFERGATGRIPSV